VGSPRAPEILRARAGDTITVFAASTRTITVTGEGRIEFMCCVHPYVIHGFVEAA